MKSTFIKNKIWNLTDESEYGIEKRFAHRVNKIDRILLKRIYGKVLEIGCGDGRFLIKVRANKRVDSIYGLDIDIASIKKARERGLDVVGGDGQALPYKDEAFDVVTSANGSPICMDWQRLFLEAHRVLKTRGIFSFDMYNRFSLEKTIKYKIMDMLKLNHKPFNGILGGVEDIRNLMDFCSKIGFKIIGLYTLFPLPFYPYGIILKGPKISRINTHLIGVLKK